MNIDKMMQNWDLQPYMEQYRLWLGASFMLATAIVSTAALRSKKQKAIEREKSKTSTTYQQLIGNTPLIKLSKLSELTGRTILVKVCHLTIDSANICRE